MSSRSAVCPVYLQRGRGMNGAYASSSQVASTGAGGSSEEWCDTRDSWRRGLETRGQTGSSQEAPPRSGATPETPGGGDTRQRTQVGLDSTRKHQSRTGCGMLADVRHVLAINGQEYCMMVASETTWNKHANTWTTGSKSNESAGSHNGHQPE